MTEQLPGWPGVVDTRLEVAGRSVRVLRAGRPDGGEPQLLVHGLGGSSVTWIDVMEGLSEHGPVVAVDLPGFGRTRPGPNDPLTVDGYVEFLVEVVDVLGWDRFTVHGNSMGGLIGTLLASQHPDRVERLVLVSPALPPRSPAHLLIPSRATIEGIVPIAISTLTVAALGVIGLAGPSLSERRNRALLRLIYPDPDGVDPQFLDLMAADFAHGGMDASQRRRALLSALRSIAATWVDPRATWRAIERISAPTLVLGGTRDALVPARVLRAVLSRRTDWQGYVLDDRRHALMLEDPAGYLEHLAQWREETDRAA